MQQTDFYKLKTGQLEDSNLPTGRKFDKYCQKQSTLSSPNKDVFSDFKQKKIDKDQISHNLLPMLLIEND